jgi:hypothetical protein
MISSCTSIVDVNRNWQNRLQKRVANQRVLGPRSIIDLHVRMGTNLASPKATHNGCHAQESTHTPATNEHSP